MKKLLAMLLVTVMVMGCLAGCSQTPVETVPDTEPETVPVQQAIQEPEVTEPEVTEPEAPAVYHGMQIQKLYKLANPSGDYEDLESAIAWAVKNGVVTDDAPFDPEAALTHLDMARFLYRYAKALDVVRDSDKLEDLKGRVWDEVEITEEADREAVAWAIGSGVMQLYQRQFLPEEAVTAYEYRVIPAKLSSLVKAVKAAQEAAAEATEPEETEPEETEESGSENEGGNSSGSGSSGNSGSSGSSGSSGNSGSSGSSGSSVTEPTDPLAPKEPGVYDKDAAMAAGNNYLAGLGCIVTSDVMWGAYNFPVQCTRKWLDENGGQNAFNQDAISYVDAMVIDILAEIEYQEGIDVSPSDMRAYCYIMDYTDPGGVPGYLIYMFYG